MMGSDRRASAPAHDSKRLYAVITLFIGLICIFAGYMLGHMTRAEIKKNNDVSQNLTIAADSLHKKANRISPKAIHHNDPEKIYAKLSAIFQCKTECGTINKYNLGDYVQSSINYEISKLIKTLNNATMYLDSLR
ncbi:uncharacterized protein LOC128677187 [Plodia interpunctella]|uniref:uncharacterized protein LOC128677187 n=1 Tax=Plodia interpunctella TaxID=58824 RepID=UPI002368B1A6|nr:uncharacterized protein LOC128677187 [Plodia interpunctella]